MKKIIYNKFVKSWIAPLPRVEFPGRIIVIASPLETESAVNHLLSMPVLGVDTETRPSFSKNQHFETSLLQVATQNECFLFRLNYTGMTPAIIRLLEDRTVPKIGLSWHDDLAGLKRLHNFTPGWFIDLQNHIKEIGIEDLSLQKMYANLFGERISKAERLSNWERDVLKPAQLSYAAIDAWACIRLYEELQRLLTTQDYELKSTEMILEIEEDFKMYEYLAAQKEQRG